MLRIENTVEYRKGVGKFEIAGFKNRHRQDACTLISDGSYGRGQLYLPTRRRGFRRPHQLPPSIMPSVGDQTIGTLPPKHSKRKQNTGFHFDTNYRSIEFPVPIGNPVPIHLQTRLYSIERQANDRS